MIPLNDKSHFRLKQDRNHVESLEVVTVVLQSSMVHFIKYLICVKLSIPMMEVPGGQIRKILRFEKEVSRNQKQTDFIQRNLLMVPQESIK